MSDWQEKAREKRNRLNSLIPTEWKLSSTILNNLPTNLTVIPYECGILSSLDLEITEIDNIEELAQKIAQGKYSSKNVIEAYCKRAAIAHQLVNCLAEMFFQEALQRAEYLDEYYRSTGGKTMGPLHGIPISLKDQFQVKGIETAIGYIGYLGEKAERNSLVVDEILELGGVVYVKTAIPQTIMMGVTESHLLGKTCNPLNRNLSCGGSSGGEGSLIAMKGSLCGLGTDIGGSIRFPSAANGIYGFRPSDGRLSYAYVRNTLEGQESVLSVIGPMTRSIANIHLFFKLILETRPWLTDPKVHNIPWREDLFQEGQRYPLAFGVILFDGITHLTPPVQRAMNLAIVALEKVGHQIIPWDASDYLEGIEMLVKMFQADGGKDVQKALKSSGESLLPGAFVGNFQTELSVYENWQLNLSRNNYALKYYEKWNQTKEKTRTGRPIDGILSPISSVPAYPDTYNLSIGYTGICNLLQLPSVIIPVTKVTSELDQITDEYRQIETVSEQDRSTKDLYQGPEIFENCIVNLQVISRRLEEEKAIGMAIVVENAIKSYQ